MSTINYLTVRNTVMPVITANTVNYSTLTGSSITVTSTITTSSLLYSTLLGRSITTTTLSLSTLTVSSINNNAPGTGTGSFSTLTVSSLVSVSSIQTASTLYTSSLLTTGSVGIGTATTLAKFHLDNGSTQGLNSLFCASGLSSGQNTSIAIGKAFSGSNCGTILWNHVSDGSTSNFLGFGAFGGDNKMNVLASGNVGIGTTTPSDSLVVNSGNMTINTGTGTSAGYIFNQGSVWGGIEVEGNGSTGAQTLNLGVNTNRTKAWNSSYGGLFLRVDTRTGSNYNGFHFFNRSAPGGTDTEIMTILSGGNVGIGSVTPSYALDVVGAMRATTGLNVGNGTAGVGLNLLDSAAAAWQITTGNSNLSINNNSASWTNRVTITQAGNVGIGTTNPATTFQVVGASSIASTTNVAFTNSGGGLNSSGGDYVNTQLAFGSGYGPWIRAVQPNSTYTDQVRLDFCTNLASNNATVVPRMSIMSGSSSSPGYVGIGTATPGYALHVIGAIYASGEITAFSDQRYKQNIVRLDRSLDKICQLGGYSYTREDYRPGEKQIGLLAQEVLTVLPEAVIYDQKDDKYSVNYGCLIAPLVESIKELQDQITSQGKTIQLLLDHLSP